MPTVTKKKLGGRHRRQLRVRKKVFGTPERPRLNVFRSSKHIYAQVIDVVKGHTLAAVSSLSKELEGQVKSGANKAAARAVGKLIAQKAKEKNITKVVFDRGGYLFHGRVKELADGAREGGLKF
jgi:large subunit ribosomal protein L18